MNGKCSLIFFVGSLAVVCGVWAEPIDSAPPSAVCSNTLGHLAPQLRPYTHHLLAEVRSAILSSPLQKQSAQSALQSAAAAEQIAAQAARTANDTDGGGNGIRRVDNGTLPLGWSCEGIHASAVCEYINRKWEALAYREIAAMTARCP